MKKKSFYKGINYCLYVVVIVLVLLCNQYRDTLWIFLTILGVIIILLFVISFLNRKAKNTSEYERFGKNKKLDDGKSEITVNTENNEKNDK